MCATAPFTFFNMCQKEEDFENWTQFYAIQGEINSTLSLEDYVRSQLASYQSGCGHENVEHIILKADEATQRVLAIFFCGTSKNASKHLGYGEDMGEVGLYWFSKTEDTLVKVYQLWRGARFVFNAPGNWHTDIPGARAQIEKMTHISINTEQ